MPGWARPSTADGDSVTRAYLLLQQERAGVEIRVAPEDVQAVLTRPA
jgi:hypothetical protein